ncbi:hypothetical protein HDU97_009557 [Phlyctochytrium planicorne]|nr:hypothetical protein HDU97_009557 [Phlyctochytrium planicorne]
MSRGEGQQDIVSLESFEHAKENIQPLQRGRSAKTLSALYGDGATSTSSRATSAGKRLEESTSAPSVASAAASASAVLELEKAEEERLRLEKAIANVKMDSDDPLDPYHRLLQWYQANHPSGHPDYAKVLEKAARGFRKDPRYKNDLRFIRIWLDVAARSRTVEDVFKYLAANDIGQVAAVFYEEYAAYLETLLKFEQADEVYKLGINRRALPAERLQKKYDAFQVRWEQHKLKEDEEKAFERTAEQKKVLRPALGTTSVSAVHSRDAATGQTSSRSNPARPASSTSSRPNGKIAIFQDTEEPPISVLGATTLKPELEIGQSRRKENDVEPEAWRSTKLPPPQTQRAPPTSRISVFCDDDVELPSDRTAAKKVFGILSAKPISEAGTSLVSVLTEPEVPVAVAKAPTSQPPDAEKKQPKDAKKDGKPQVNERYLWDIEKLVKNNEEFSFEELRAQMSRYKVGPNAMQAALKPKIAMPTIAAAAPAPPIKSALRQPQDSKSSLAVAKDQKAEWNPVAAEVPKKAPVSVKKDASDVRAVAKENAPVAKPSILKKGLSQQAPKPLVPVPIMNDNDNDDDDDEDDDAWESMVKADRFGRTIVPVKATGFVSKKLGNLPSPTINTKAALADVFDMFNAPLPAEVEAEEEAEREERQHQLQQEQIRSKPLWHEVENDETVSSKVFKRASNEKFGVFVDEDAKVPQASKPAVGKMSIFVDENERPVPTKTSKPTASESKPPTKGFAVFRDENEIEDQPKETNRPVPTAAAASSLPTRPTLYASSSFSLENGHNRSFEATPVLDVESPFVEQSEPKSKTSKVFHDDNAVSPPKMKSILSERHDENDENAGIRGGKSRDKVAPVAKKLDTFEDFEVPLSDSVPAAALDLVPGDVEEEDESFVQFPDDFRAYPSARMSVGGGARSARSMMFKDAMTPIMEASFEGGDRTIAGLSTIFGGGSSKFRYSAAFSTGSRIGEDGMAGRESLDGISNITFSGSVLGDRTISSISAVNCSTASSDLSGLLHDDDEVKIQEEGGSDVLDRSLKFESYRVEDGGLNGTDAVDSEEKEVTGNDGEDHAEQEEEEEDLQLVMPCDPFHRRVQDIVMKTAEFSIGECQNYINLSVHSDRAEAAETILNGMARTVANEAKMKRRRSIAGTGVLCDVQLMPGFSVSFRFLKSLGVSGNVFLIDAESDEDDGEFLSVIKSGDRSLWEFYVASYIRTLLPEDLLPTVVEPMMCLVLPNPDPEAVNDAEFLRMRYQPLGNLGEALELARDGGFGSGYGAGGDGAFDELLAAFWTAELIKMTEMLHRVDVVHGQIEATNLMIRLPGDQDEDSADAWSMKYSAGGKEGWGSVGLHLVDFSLSLPLRAFSDVGEEDPMVPEDLERMVFALDNGEMVNGVGLVLQDWRGVLGVVYGLVFGSEIEDLPSIDVLADRLKQKAGWSVGLWTGLFEVLLEVADMEPTARTLEVGTAKIGQCRAEMESWLERESCKGGKSLKSLLQRVEIAFLS